MEKGKDGRERSVAANDGGGGKSPSSRNAAHQCNRDSYRAFERCFAEVAYDGEAISHLMHEQAFRFVRIDLGPDSMNGRHQTSKRNKRLGPFIFPEFAEAKYIDVDTPSRRHTIILLLSSMSDHRVEVEPHVVVCFGIFRVSMPPTYDLSPLETRYEHSALQACQRMSPIVVSREGVLSRR